MKRLRLLLVLATMPEEAFGWFVVWASGVNTHYPDGLGGFRAESRDSIGALRAAASEYMNSPEAGHLD